MQQLVETRLAVMAMHAPHFVEVRFRQGVLIDPDGIAEIMNERKRLAKGDPVALLVVIPNDAELDVAVINSDHYQANQSADNVIGLAMVVTTMLAETLVSLYQAYYPVQFPMKVLTSEEEARRWLQGLIDARTTT